MARHYYIFLISCSFILLFACSKSVDDGLAGKWKLRSITDNGEVTNLDSIYYSFDRGVLRLQYLDKNSSFGMYRIEGDSIIMEIKQPALPVDKLLDLYFWEAAEMKFRVMESNRKKLILQRKEQVFVFDKF